MITYQTENNITVTEFQKILNSSSLGERRPVENIDRLALMLKHANLIITARIQGEIIGVSRSLTDFTFCTYLSDIAVDERYQHKGVGKELIRQTKLATGDAKLILLSAPKAVTYYPKIGMHRHEYCYYIDSVNEINS